MVFGTGETEGIEKQWRKSLVGSLPVSVLPLIVSACFCESANGGAVARFGFRLCI